MKTKRLRKVRDLHPIYYNENLKKYQYLAGEGKVVDGSTALRYDYKSKYVKDYKTLLKERRKRILMDAKRYFFSSLFCYKRKNRNKTYRIF